MRGPMKIEKAKDTKKALKNLLAFCKKYWGIIVFALLLATVSSVLTILGPNKIG